MPAPVSQATLSVGTSPVAVLAPQDCLAVTVQQQQGSAPPAPNFNILATDGSTVLSSQQGGTNFTFTAPAGTKFRAGTVVGYIETVAGTVNFTVFADPVVGGAELPTGLGNVAFTTITSAQLLAIQTTAIGLVPAPPMGFFLVARKLVLQYKFVATHYTIANADNAFRLQYTGKTVALIGPLVTGLMDQIVDTTISQGPAVAQAAIARTNVEALGLELKLATGTGPVLTVGDGLLYVTLFYDTVPLQ